MKISIALFVIQCLFVLSSDAQTAVTITSPGKKLEVQVSVNQGKQINYTILNNNQVVL